MKEIVIKDDFAFIYLNSSFYTKIAISSAIEIYKDFFKAELTQLGKYYIVKIKVNSKDFTLETLANEFLNYILSNEYQKNN